MTKRLKLSLAVVAVLAAVGLAVWFIPRPRALCETGEYSRLVGVGVEVQVDQVKALQGTLGLSDSLVRGLDTILRDYSAKYDNACRDATQGLITREQYQCMRQQIERNLDSARRVTQATDAAKAGADPAVQRVILQAALDELQRAREAGFGDTCVPGLEVNPKQVSFRGITTAAFIQLVNASPSPLTYAISEFPDGFMPSRTSGTVQPADHVDIVIRRTLDPLPSTRPLRARIKVGFRTDLAVEFIVDAANARLWQDLGDQLRGSSGGAPTVADAVALVDRSIETGKELPGAERHALAATALFVGGFHSQAAAALQSAVDADRELASNPATLRLATLITAQRPEGQRLYATVRELQPTFKRASAEHGTNVSGVIGAVRFNSPVLADGQPLLPGM